MHLDSPVTYNVIGTAASPATLTAAFTGNRLTLFSKYMRFLHLDVTFTPGAGSTNSQALILLETSNEEGASGATNFYPLSTQTGATTEVDIYADSGYSMSTANGIPYVIPGDKTSTAGTAIATFMDINDINAAYVRISARDSGSANFGTLHIRATLKP